MSVTDVDVAIIGGGLVGASLALALTHQKVALVDARLPQADDQRLFALSASSCQFLQNIGVWEALSPCATPIHDVHVSYQKHFGVVRLKRELVDLPALGFVIPAHKIESVLQAALLKKSQLPEAQLTLYRPATLEHIEQNPTHAYLTIKQEDQYKRFNARCVIAADGTHSTVRTLLNMPVETIDYAQSALVTRTQLSRSHQHIAHERLMADGAGAIAMLPLEGDFAATIWSAETKVIDDLRALSEQDFLRTLQSHFGYKLGRLRACYGRHRYPLTYVRATCPVQGNVLLIGNAAHTLHPIAAQGFNLALFEVATVAAGLRENKHLHAIYQTLQSQLTVSCGLSHGLARLFAMRSGFVGAALQMGMLTLERVSPLKRQLLMRLLRLG